MAMTLTQAREILREAQAKCVPDDPLGTAIDVVLGTPEQPTFILLTKDRFAPQTVQNWIYAVRVLGEDAKEKIKEATDVFTRMLAFHNEHHEDVKNPK